MSMILMLEDHSIVQVQHSVDWVSLVSCDCDV